MPVHGAAGHEAVLQAAKKFDAFLTGGAGAKPAAKKAAAVEEEEGGEEGEEVTAEQVETVIADLLGANLRKQAVALLAEYGAKSASGVKAADRVEFYGQAQTLLLGS